MKRYIIYSPLFIRPLELLNNVAFNTLINQLQLNSIEYSFEIKDAVEVDSTEQSTEQKPFGKRAPKYKSGVIGRQNN
jgi:hypothetical protein